MGSGVSDGFGELFFFLALGDFSGVADFFFFFPFGEASLPADFFGFGFALASGVSLGVADVSDSSLGDFLFFGFGVADGVGDFCFLCGELLVLGVGLSDSSAALTARAFRMTGDFSGVSCA